MDDATRREVGLKVRREVLGGDHVARARANTTLLTEDFQDLITRYAWGEIWTRPGLDRRTRRLMVLSTTIALGRWEEFRMHAAAALHSSKKQRVLAMRRLTEPAKALPLISG
jgi:alkylhydroperoxidase/carboxymuconolactone decarboxylase family protein YurZ